ncbi:MAG TPA: hypothetical protein VHL34_19500 [Rhizomicrobium sp.]|jgi:hypothetical protein|nr:hypothetical protein [Rhizomicrobium sp.]
MSPSPSSADPAENLCHALEMAYRPDTPPHLHHIWKELALFWLSLISAEQKPSPLDLAIEVEGTPAAADLQV